MKLWTEAKLTHLFQTLAGLNNDLFEMEFKK